MMWKITLAMTSFLSLTVNALPAPSATPSSSASIFSSLLTSFIQNTDLTNCPLDSITLPASTLPSPSDDLSLKHIVLGRGTQNYTCVDDTADSTPSATGATATLFDASCLASAESLLHLLPEILKPIPLSNDDFLADVLHRLTGQDLVLGRHYFTADGVPFFDLRRGKGSEDDWVAAKKDSEADAPAKPGYGLTGDVAWLKLDGTHGGFKEVYRVHTAGGSAPENCEGLDGELTVDYSAEYWFYA
ncbi:hypothetical protein BDV18DRAFT_110365 [Aspergillus unguis]